MEFPRDDLTREVSFRVEPSNDGLTLEGYAAVFNTPTRIDSWEGTFDEQIAAGAFTMAGSARNPRVQILLANVWQRLVTDELEGASL